MQFSETPFLLASKSIIDPGTFDDSYKQGQAIRQAYDVRLHQKAMNEIMRLPDFETQMTAAQASKYAGALVPMVQAYEDERQKTALNNLKSSAEIGKIFGETGKLGAETGKIDAESQTKIYSELIPALSGSPHTFLQNIGEMGKKGLLSDKQVEQYGKIMLLPTSQQVQAFGAIIKSNPEMAKILVPQLKDMDLGGSRQLVSFDPQTGQVTDGGNYSVSVDPTKKYVADKGYQGDVYRADKGYQGDVYKSDKGYQGTVYSTDGRTQVAKLDNQGRLQIAWANNQSDEKIASMKASSAGAAAKPMPTGDVKELNAQQSTLNNAAANMKSIAKWIGILESGQLKLGTIENARNASDVKYGTKIGNNSAQYAELFAFTKSMANALLRENKGVQTDMDYKRQLEAVQAGNGMPKDNATAVVLLNRMMNDYRTIASTAYTSARNVLTNRGRGESLPASYGTFENTSAPKPQTSNPNVTTSTVADLWQ